MIRQDGGGKKKQGKGKKQTYQFWRNGRLVFVRPADSPAVNASRKSASASLMNATARAVQREATTGSTPAQIAVRLGISEKAVAKHLAAIAESARSKSEGKSTLNIPLKSDRNPKAASVSRKPRRTTKTSHSKRQTPKRPKVKQSRSTSPDPTKVDEAIRRRLEVSERHAARLRSLPVGESDLEKLAKTGDLAAALEQIHYLAHKKDDPYAWRDLALAFRSRPLRTPVGDALKTVGPEKVLLKIRENPSPMWGQEVVAFLESAIVAGKPKGPLRREPLPHERPNGVWWSD